IIDAFTQCGDNASHFVAHTRRESRLGRRKVLPPEDVIPADAYRLDTYLYLTGCRQRGRMLFDLEHLGWAKLMKTNRAGHFEPRLMNLDAMNSIRALPGTLSVAINSRHACH